MLLLLHYHRFRYHPYFLYRKQIYYVYHYTLRSFRQDILTKHYKLISIHFFALLDYLSFHSGRAVRISTFYECDSTVEAFSFLRFVHANTKEIPYLPRLDDDFDLARRPIPPLSPDNEIGVLQHLASLCQHQLSLYPSTLADDNHILDSQQYSYGSNRRNALVLVKGEKEVCHFYIALAKLAVPILQMRWPEANTLITKQYSQINNDAHKYIRSIVGPLLQKHFENTAIDLGTLGNNNSTATISGHRSGGFNYGYSTNNGGGYL